MPEAELAREPGVLRPIADEEALHGIERMAMDEGYAQARQRLAAPAARRAGAVRADVEVEAQSGAVADLGE